RIGIPISLSTIYLEVGRRVGVPLAGVAFPGHFLVRYVGRDVSEEVLIDPFNRGTMLTVDECRRRLEEMYEGAVAFRPEFLRRARNKEILERMLNNLKAIYQGQRDFHRALRVQELLLCVSPASGRHLLVEAGTGIGKSLGYLVPAILWANRPDPGEPLPPEERRVVISTHTRALQEQLARRDLPFLERALAPAGIAFRHALLMGSENYLCVQRLNEIGLDGALPRDEAALSQLDVAVSDRSVARLLDDLGPSPRRSRRAPARQGAGSRDPGGPGRPGAGRLGDARARVAEEAEGFFEEARRQAEALGG